MFILSIWKAFAIETNRQVLVDSFLLYEESPVANLPINIILIVRVSSGSILVRIT